MKPKRQRQTALRERFHAMRLSDPLYYRFSEIWTRIATDRSIAYGLYRAERGYRSETQSDQERARSSS